MSFKYVNKLSMIQTISILMFLFVYSSGSFAGNQYEKTNFYDPEVKKQLKQIPRIDAAKALWLYRSGKLILIDTHEHVKEGDKSPIVGAIALSYKKIPKVNIKIPKNRIVACFCH